MALFYLLYTCITEKGKSQTKRVKCNFETLSPNHYYRGKTMSITYPMCVFIGIVIQNMKCVHYIIRPFMACMAVPCISHFIL
jgi:hypothetical protein